MNNLRQHGVGGLLGIRREQAVRSRLVVATARSHHILMCLDGQKPSGSHETRGIATTRTSWDPSLESQINN